MQKTIVTIVISCIFFVSCSLQPDGWVLLHPSNNPPPLADSGFAFDTNSNEAVIFGGLFKGKLSDETWIWDGDWHKIDSQNRPPARQKVAMAYDETRDRIVLFGGWMDKTAFNDTWEWDGKNWQLMSSIHKPPARCCHAMAYDSVQNKVLLYGGWNQTTGEFFNDTWEWDGKDWKELPHGDVPLIAAHTLVNFSATNKVVVMPSTEGDNTWQWDGEKWHEIVSHPNPSRADARSAYDSNNKRAIFFGGIKNSTLLNDIWIFNGQDWNLLNISVLPPARYAHVLFYDAKRQSIILFGGVGSEGILNDTWELKLTQDLSALTVNQTPTP